MAHKEYELTQAVLRYAASCTRECDRAALRELGFGERECEALSGLTLADLARLEQKVDGHVLHVQLDRGAFWVLIEQLRRETALDEIKTELIRRDAPATMMQSVFGMGEKEYTAARRTLHAPRGVGRPPELDESTARRVWLAWKRRGGDARLPRAEEWLAMADESGACLRVIWRFVQRWLEDRTPSDACEDTKAARSRDRRSGGRHVDTA